MAYVQKENENMKNQKINEYNVTASIHTICIKCPGMIRFDEDMAQVYIPSYRKDKKGNLYTKCILNVNKLVGQCYSFEDFETALETALSGTDIDEYEIVRADMAIDTFEKGDYKKYCKLNRMLVSLLCDAYEVRNNYDTKKLFSQRQISMSVKGNYFHIEAYDKEEESNETSEVTNRLEMRTVRMEQHMLKTEFLHNWGKRWERALQHYQSVCERYNKYLLESYKEQCEFTDVKVQQFLIQNRELIFSPEQMRMFLSEIGYSKSIPNFVRNFKQNYEMEWIRYNDVCRAIEKIMSAMETYFDNTQKIVLLEDGEAIEFETEGGDLSEATQNTCCNV